MSIFGAFANEACALGRNGTWSADRIDNEAREFLRSITGEAWVKYSQRDDLHLPTLINSTGYMDRRIMEHLEIYPEWQYFQSDLLQVAKIHAQAHNLGAGLVKTVPQVQPTPSTPNPILKLPRASRTFREPNIELLKNLEATLNRKNAAQALGISERTLDRWVADTVLTPSGPGVRKRFKVKDLTRILNQKKRDKVDNDRQE